MGWRWVDGMSPYCAASGSVAAVLLQENRVSVPAILVYAFFPKLLWQTAAVHKVVLASWSRIDLI